MQLERVTPPTARDRARFLWAKRDLNLTSRRRPNVVMFHEYCCVLVYVCNQFKLGNYVVCAWRVPSSSGV